jgi:hypothetical protein
MPTEEIDRTYAEDWRSLHKASNQGPELANLKN